MKLKTRVLLFTLSIVAGIVLAAVAPSFADGGPLILCPPRSKTCPCAASRCPTLVEASQ